MKTSYRVAADRLIVPYSDSDRSRQAPDFALAKHNHRSTVAELNSEATWSEVRLRYRRFDLSLAPPIPDGTGGKSHTNRVGIARGTVARPSSLKTRFLRKNALFVAKGIHGIDAHGSAHWNIAGD